MTRRAGARARVQDVALALLATSVDDAPPIAQVACRLGVSPHQVHAWAAAAWRRQRKARSAPLRRRR